MRNVICLDCSRVFLFSDDDRCRRNLDVEGHTPCPRQARIAYDVPGQSAIPPVAAMKMPVVCYRPTLLIPATGLVLRLGGYWTSLGELADRLIARSNNIFYGTVFSTGGGYGTWLMDATKLLDAAQVG